MIKTVRSGFGVIFLCGLLATTNSLAAVKPQRIVSLNVCADQLVLLLADISKVSSVTWLARDADVSGVSDLALEVPINFGLTEEVVPLKPDLVVAGAYTTRNTVAFLKRLGIAVLDLDVPQSIAAMQDQLRTVAKALGEAARGEDLIATMNTRLAALPKMTHGPRPLAAVWRPNGSTAGPGSLINEIVQAAGFDNLAARSGVMQYDQLSLEALILGHPYILILNSDDEKLPSLAQELMHHPVLKAAFTATQTVVVPEHLWACGGPGVIDAIEILTRGRQSLCPIPGVGQAVTDCLTTPSGSFAP